MPWGRDLAHALVLVALAGPAMGCSRDVVLELRFASEGISRATTRLDTFVFPVAEGEEGEICTRLSPYGAPPTDAPGRYGRSPAYEARAPRVEDVARFESLPSGTWAVAIDAYGQPCRQETSSPDGKETLCATYESGDATVLRAHGCGLVSDEDLGTSGLDLRTTAPIGSRMSDPVGLYASADDPLAIVEGLPARDDLLIQLVDERADEANGVAVHWSIALGSASVEGPASRETARATFDTPESNALEAEGISAAVVRAGVTAADQEAGRIRVQAHAPGFEGSPRTFEARAVRGVEVELRSMTLELARDVASPRFFPVVVDDLDQDGRAEVVFARAEGPDASAVARLVILARGTDGVFRALSSDPIPGEITAIVPFHRRATGTRALAVFSAARRSQSVDIPMVGRQRVIVDPAVQLFTFEGGSVVAVSGRITTELPCSTGACAAVPMSKMVAAADAGDLNADGIDELAVSRCSYAENGGSSHPQVDCYAPSSATSPFANDNEVNVLAFEGQGASTVVRRVSSFQARDLEGFSRRGGINEVRFADLNGDQRLDLVFAQPLLTVGLCGNGQAERGYGFSSGEQVPFDVSTTIDDGYSVAVGRFTNDARQDVIAGGGMRAAGAFAAISLIPSEQCKFGVSGNELDIGPPAQARALLFRARDMNQDGFDDVAAFHLEQGELRTFFGTGTRQLARGPTVLFGDRHLSTFDAGADGPEGRETLIAGYEPTTGRVFLVAVRPRP